MFRKKHPKAGARPGTLLIHHESPPPVIRVMEYTPESVKEHEIAEVDELRRFLQADASVWVDVQGFGDEKAIRAGAAYRPLNDNTAVFQRLHNVRIRPPTFPLRRMGHPP